MRRRDILKQGLSAGFLLTAGSATAQAQSESGENGDIDISTADIERLQKKKTEVIADYDDIGKVQATLEAHATPVLEELHERDVISSPDTNQLNLGERRESSDQSEADLRPGSDDKAWDVKAANFGDGGAIRNMDSLTPHIMISGSTNDYNYGIYIQPENDEAYAILDSDENRELISPDSESCKTHCGESHACDDDDLCYTDCTPQYGIKYWTEVYFYDDYKNEEEGVSCGGCRKPTEITCAGTYNNPCVYYCDSCDECWPCDC